MKNLVNTIVFEEYIPVKKHFWSISYNKESGSIIDVSMRTKLEIETINKYDVSDIRVIRVQEKTANTVRNDMAKYIILNSKITISTENIIGKTNIIERKYKKYYIYSNVKPYTMGIRAKEDIAYIQFKNRKISSIINSHEFFHLFIVLKEDPTILIDRMVIQSKSIKEYLKNISSVIGISDFAMATKIEGMNFDPEKHTLISFYDFIGEYK